MFKFFNQTLRHWIMPPDAHTATGLDYWRNEFFFMVCRLLLVGGFPVLALSVITYTRIEQVGMSYAIAGFIFTINALILWRRLRPRFRRWGLITLFYLVGIFLLARSGSQGTAFVFLFAHPILAAVFFGRKEAQISLWTNGLTLLAMNLALLFLPPLQFIVVDYFPLKWITISLVFVLLNAVVTNATTQLVMGLHHALSAEIAVRTDLESEIESRILLEETLKEERENLQVRVDQRTALLAKANADLMKSMKFKDAFFDSIRHEFRTPIHAISGYTDLLFTRPDSLTEKQRNYLTRIREAADHLLSVINNILDTTRIQAGMLDINLMVISLDEVCGNAVAYVEGLAVRKGVAIESVIEQTGINVKADAQRFKQVMMNLLENAVKYTPQGGKVGIDLEQTEKELRLTVWDMGIGIPDEDINNIFEPFYRSENRYVQDVEGTGLGLSLTKQLVQAHDWSLSVDSELGKGSRFTIHIPARDITEHSKTVYY